MERTNDKNILKRSKMTIDESNCNWMQDIWIWADYHKIKSELIPRTKEELISLKILNLRDQNIEDLPPHLGKMQNLHEIYCNENKLKSIVEEVFSLKNLKYFDFSDNLISEIPSNIAELDQLTDFHISNNKIKNLPNEIIALDNLLMLDISENELLSLSAEQKIWINTLAEGGCHVSR